MSGRGPLALVLLLAAALPVSAAGGTFSLRLERAQAAALERSPALKASEADRVAAQAQARGRLSALLPRLAFDAAWRRQDVVPTLQLPGGPAQPFGDRESWSYGPSLEWTLWDSGASWRAWKSLSAMEAVRRADAAALRRQVLLETRLSYFQVQLDLEQVRLLADSLRLAQAQHEDVARRLEFRAASRIDLLTAHQEVLTRRRQLRQARADLGASLRELFSRTGDDPGADLSLALDPRSAADLPADVEAASLLVELQPLGETLPEFERPTAAAGEHPRLRALGGAAESSRLAALSASSERWPRVQLSAKTDREYPNGPRTESVHQSWVGLSLRLPLFEGGRIVSESSRREREAFSATQRRAQAELELERERLKAQDQLAGLRAQRELCRQAVEETEELSRLVYESYKGGRSTFLDVQSANLQALEAKVQAARTDARTLAQLAVLRSLSSEE